MDDVDATAVLTVVGSEESVGGVGVGVHCSAEGLGVAGVADGLTDDREKEWRSGRVGSGENKAPGVPLSPPSRLRMSRLGSAGRAWAERAKARQERTRIVEQGREIRHHVTAILADGQRDQGKESGRERSHEELAKVIPTATTHRRQR
jgi:hypothetical protein